MSIQIQGHHAGVFEFNNAAQSAITCCQLVEEVLKNYITLCNDVIALSLKGAIPYSYTQNEIEGYSLERLIAHFKKLNANEVLIQNLKGLPERRNYCAHKAFIAAAFKAGKGSDLNAEIQEVKDIGIFARNCFEELYKELERVEKVREQLKAKV